VPCAPELKDKHSLVVVVGVGCGNVDGNKVEKSVSTRRGDIIAHSISKAASSASGIRNTDAFIDSLSASSSSDRPSSPTGFDGDPTVLPLPIESVPLEVMRRSAAIKFRP
jgi:hypothetical protein